MSNNEQASITVLRFPDCVRLRRHMYINSKNHAIDEIVDNCIDEHFAGRCDSISVEIINADGVEVVIVTDNGSGIPVTKHPDPEYKNLTQAEVAYTVLHAGGKFGSAGKDGYKTATGGLHGVGASCVNALSSKLFLTTYQKGVVYEAVFEKGKIISNMQPISEYTEDFSGTQVKFILDDEIWGDEKFNFKHLAKRLKQIAYLNPKLTIVYSNEFTQEEETFHYPEGVKSYVEKLSAEKSPLHSIEYYSDTIETFSIQCSFCYTQSFYPEIYSFCNNIATESGGDHLIGFNHGIQKAVNDYCIQNKLIKEDDKFEINDCLEGIVGVVSVIVVNPQFEGQGKTKIKMPGIRNAIKNYVAEKFFSYLDHHPEYVDAIVNRVLLAQKARISAQNARENARKTKDALQGNVKGLADCQEKDPALCEIFIVEGDSAGGSAKSGRNRKTQAILPIFGKILNTEKSVFSKVLDNVKIGSLIKALKCGIADEFDIKKLRYHKIILLSDADVDGYHIQTLYITFFYRYYREIIENGYLYIGQPPLFKIETKKEHWYAYSDEEKEKIIQGIPNTNYKVQRYKGLGEMNADQLWETTLNPEHRTLIRITLQDAEEAENMVTTCMSEDISSRKKFIEEYAKYAQ